jgi:signal transduction histidine kinase
MTKRGSAQSQTCLGLLTMREQAEALVGSLRITSGYRKGIIVEAALPLPAESGKEEEHT